MRVFSSRRESITADLRVRAARFEQRYGRAPSQRELAHLAQASNFKTRNAKHGALDLAQAHAGWADKLARTLGVSLASVAPSVWHGAAGRARRARARRRRARFRRARAGPRGAEGGRAGAAGKEHVDPRGCDQVPGPGPAPDRPGSRPRPPPCWKTWPTGRWRQSSNQWPAWKHPSRPRSRAACCAPTGAASTSGTAAPGTPRARSWPWKNAWLAQARASGAPRLTRAQAAHALGADLAQLTGALAGHARRRRGAQTHAQAAGCARTRPPPRSSVLTDGKRVSVINAPAGSGKTHVLAEIGKAWTAAGLGPVIGVTASQSARNTLAAGVPASRNAAQFLGHLPGPARRPWPGRDRPAAAAADR